MKSTSILLALLASFAIVPVVTAEESDEFELPLEIVNLKKKPPEEEKFFYVLPRIKLVEGSAEVRKFGTDEWVSIEEGRHYPLGSAFRATGLASKLVVALGRECLVTIRSGASFETKAELLDERMKSRTVRLLEGSVSLKLPLNLPAGKLFVSAPGFVVEGLAGESRFVRRVTVDGDDVAVKCVTGVMAIKGRHFEFPAVRVASEIRIRTSNDNLYTGIFGLAGDSIVKLDQGVIQKKDFESNEVIEEQKFLEWKLSPRTSARIMRIKPSLGENMGVSVMTFMPEGRLKNRCTFVEKMYCLNTGEQGPTTKAEKDEIAKKAAAAAEAAGAGETITEEADVEEDDAEADHDGESNDDSSGYPVPIDDDFDF